MSTWERMYISLENHKTEIEKWYYDDLTSEQQANLEEAVKLIWQASALIRLTFAKGKP